MKDHDDPTQPSNPVPDLEVDAEAVPLSRQTIPPAASLPTIHQETVSALASAVDALLETRLRPLETLSQKLDMFRRELADHQAAEKRYQERTDRQLSTWLAGQREQGTRIELHDQHLARHDGEIEELRRRVADLETADTEPPAPTPKAG